MTAGVQTGRRSVAFDRGGLKKALLVGLFSLLIPSLSFSSFQESMWGARPAAMGGAFTAIANDANAPLYNPAGLAFITDNEVTLMYAQLYTGLDLYAGEDRSNLGLGYMSWSPNVQNKRWGSFAVSWANFTASSLYREDTFMLSYAESFIFEQFAGSPVVAFGGNLKFLRRSFSTDEYTTNDVTFAGGRDSSALTGDVGVLYKPNFAVLPGLNLGLNVQNLTEPDMGLRNSDRVPLRSAIGIAYQDPSYRWLNPALDVSRRDGRTLISAGWESYFAEDRFAFRFGGSEDQIAGGLGYRFQLFSGLSLKLDYALLWPLNIEGTNGSHRVSLTTNF